MQELGMAADDVTIGENTEVAESNTQDEKKAIKYICCMLHLFYELLFYL